MSASRLRARPLLLGEVALVAFLLFGYDRVAATANIDPGTAYRHGHELLALEKFLHLAVELPANHVVAAWHHLGQVLSVYYDFAHGIVTLGVLALVYVLAPAGYRRARSALLVVQAMGLVVFWLIPVAPPRLLPGGGFFDVVAHSGTWGAWEAGSAAISEHANQFASLPSLHVASAVWVLRCVVAASASRRWRTLAGVHLGVTVVIVVVTGNHYLLDVVAGAALGEGAWWATAPARLHAPVAGLRERALLTGASRR